MLTFLPMEEVERLSALEGEQLNAAKEILAFEVTRLIHGREEAEKAREAARAAFGGGGDMANVPATLFERSRFEGEGLGAATLLKECGLVPSNGEGFRTIEQGGLMIDGEKVTDPKLRITLDRFGEDGILLKKGKKTFHRVQIEEDKE
jgi:tyrosyl-tRNA synthetase